MKGGKGGGGGGDNASLPSCQTSQRSYRLPHLSVCMAGTRCLREDIHEFSANTHALGDVKNCQCVKNRGSVTL